MSSNTSVAEPDKVSATLNLKCDLRYQVKVKAATRKGFSADSSHVVVPKATGINIRGVFDKFVDNLYKSKTSQRIFL